MKYNSTRNNGTVVSASEAIVAGISSVDGGLFVPQDFPKVSLEEISSYVGMSYSERATAIIGKYLTEFSSAKLLNFCEKAYSRFEEVAPLVKVADGAYFLELWHGPTCAFKDIALTLLPHLMVESKLISGNNARTMILVATSGDTGKAALEGFRDVEGTDILVLYPSEGVSNLQKLQMRTQEGENVEVYGIEGNFDDAQTAVKQIFTSKEMSEQAKASGVEFSSANSINWGRLVPQIAYYFSSYADLLDGGEIELGDKINFCVPSGNFGNILAGYYAYRMGLPIGKLICASNRNNILTDFFGSGEYDINRPFYKTSSPSMDILISSNLERLVYELCGRDDKLTTLRMRSLISNGVYNISKTEWDNLQELFYADCCEEEEIKDTIAEWFDEYGYIMDTHTAVATCVFDKYNEEHPGEKTVIVSTASPYKFVGDVLDALGESKGKTDTQSLLKLERLTALPIPDGIKSLDRKPLLHDEVCKIDEVNAKVLAFITKTNK